MQNVNIYTLNNQRCISPKEGKAIYMLESERTGKTSIGFVELIARKNTFEMLVMIHALERLNQPCNVTIFPQCDYVPQLIKSGQLEKWEQNEWKTYKNEPVKDKEVFLMLKDAFKKHNVEFNPVIRHQYVAFLEKQLSKCIAERKNEEK